MFLVKNKTNGGYVRTWQYKKGDPGAIEVIYSGLIDAMVFPHLNASRIFVQHITFNNVDNCDIDDLEIEEWTHTLSHSPLK